MQTAVHAVAADVDLEGWHALNSHDPEAVLIAGNIRLVPKEIFDLASV